MNTEHIEALKMKRAALEKMRETLTRKIHALTADIADASLERLGLTKGKSVIEYQHGGRSVRILVKGSRLWDDGTASISGTAVKRDGTLGYPQRHKPSNTPYKVIGNMIDNKLEPFNP